MTAHDIVGGVVWGQIMVLMAALVFAVFELCYALTGARRYFQTRRRVGQSVCASVLLLPLIMPVVMATPYAETMNATDAVVSQYLKGNISISAMEMNRIVEFRSSWVSDIASGASFMGQAILIAFLMAAAGRAVYLLVNFLRIRRSLKGGRVIRSTKGLSVVVSRDISVPFSTRGLFRHYVVLPQAMMADRSAISMALGHELQHIRQGDVTAEVLIALASPLYVLNPGYWYLSSRIRKLGELACDRAYLARNLQDAHSYSLRLLNTARFAAKAKRQPSAFGVALTGRSLPWRGRRSMLKSRILEIAKDVDQPLEETRWVGFALSVALSIAIVGAATSLSKPGDWSHERIMLSTVVNLERIDQLNSLAQRSW
ncbi:M56 family metallopeptidase [Thalassococcus lentus]|uniref:M56 family metallopeptidase n=1 Tax=Thalassococcus lentus TaxID=1210524 RepID=A0ABT4XPW7_9RHOB|nr:M56 family metallopeptidase [Thalassococcus lentus]MDA7423976.1 M56 family metallopeptidase [Thalassococcus lentus]